MKKEPCFLPISASHQWRISRLIFLFLLSFSTKRVSFSRPNILISISVFNIFSLFCAFVWYWKEKLLWCTHFRSRFFWNKRTEKWENTGVNMIDHLGCLSPFCYPLCLPIWSFLFCHNFYPSSTLSLCSCSCPLIVNSVYQIYQQNMFF